MLSQITGATVGIAKNINIVVVQYGTLSGEQELLAALTAVLQDVSTSGKSQVIIK
jgi:hypothetical protein